MTAIHNTARGPAAFPLGLAGGLLAVSLITAAVVGVVSKASPLDSLEALGQWLTWFCGVGLLIAINVAMAATAVTRHGTPQRFALALVTAMLTFYGAAFLLSLGRGELVNAWIVRHPGEARALLGWLPFASLLQMLVVAAVSVALAWKVGGRSAVPVAWPKGARRALGAIVGFGACVGLLPLQARLIAMLDVVPLQTLQSGLPFLAVTLGVAHALAWALWPARAGSGAWPAFVSAALVGPLLLALAWLSQFVLVRIEQPAVVGAVAGVLLLACPLLAWAGSRAAANHWWRATPG